MSYPMNHLNSPYYERNWMILIYQSIMIGIATITMDMIFALSMIMMMRQFSLIQMILKDLDKYANAIYDDRQFAAIGLERNDDSVTLEDVYYGILSQCIDHYARLIKMRNNIQAVLGVSLLAQLLCSAIIICMTLFNTSSFDPSRLDRAAINMIFFTAAIMQISLYCWYGQQMTNEAAKVREDAYLINWEKRPKRFCDALRMLIKETAKPLHVSAAGFANLTLPTCQSILRAAGSYFTLLRSLEEEE